MAQVRLDLKQIKYSLGVDVLGQTLCKVQSKLVVCLRRR